MASSVLDGASGAPGLEGVDPDETARRELRQSARGYLPTAEDRKRVSFVEKRYDQAERAKRPYARGWATSLAFYVGEHYREWNAVSRQLVANDDIPPWRVRLTDNQVTTLALTVAAKRSKARHVTIGMPNNPQDPDDLHAARLGTKVLRHLDRTTNRARKRIYADLQSTLYGTAFLMPYWDPNRKTKVAITDPATGMVRGKEAWAGDVDLEVLDVWKVFPEPTSAWEEVTWCVIARVRTLEWVRTTFPREGRFVDSDGGEGDLFATMERTAASPVQSPGESDTRGETVRVLDYYEKPSRMFPQGRWIVVANGVLLYHEEALPSPKHRFPIVPYLGMYVPGRLWGRGWVEDLVDQQRELNRTESQIIENKNLMGRPKWRVYKESKLHEDALHDGPGEVVEVNYAEGVPGPEQLPALPLPQYVAEMPDRIKESMRNIAGVHEASTGNTIPGAPGVVLDLQQQADDTRLSQTTQLAAESWKDVDGQMLELVQAGYDIPRMIQVFGRDQDDEAIAFMGSDLGENTEVGLDTTEGITDSVAALRQRILDYNAAQLFEKPLDVQIELFTIAGETQLAEMVQRMQERAIQQQQAQLQGQLAGMQEGAGAVPGGEGPEMSEDPSGMSPGGPVGALPSFVPPQMLAAMPQPQGAM